jgi:auxin influx carrier (AUX1 LAX family)
MDDPTAYDRCYFYSYLYVFTLTIPNVVATYYVYGDECKENANAFSLYDVSVQRDIGIVMMVIHQMVAFGLFSGPLYHVLESYWGVNGGSYFKRVLYRVPVAVFLLFLAVAVPFYGSVNALLGAFATSMATYVIPLVAYNLAYQAEEAREGMIKRPPPMVYKYMRYMFAVNWILAGLVFVCGVCIGGTAATLKLLEDYRDFHFFAECYECDDVA